MLEAIFSDGVNVVTVTGLTQWDKGRKLYIKGLDLPPLVEVHFADKINTVAIRMIGAQEYNYTVVEIPNIVLENTHDIHAWVYVIDGNQEKTVRNIYLKVEKRAKPQDHVSDNPVIDDTLNDIINFVNAKIASMQSELDGKLSVSAFLDEMDIESIIDGTYVEEGGDQPSEVVDGEPIPIEELNKIFV